MVFSFPVSFLDSDLFCFSSFFFTKVKMRRRNQNYLSPPCSRNKDKWEEKLVQLKNLPKVAKVQKVHSRAALNPTPPVEVPLKAQNLVTEQKVPSQSKSLHPIWETTPLSARNLVKGQTEFLQSRSLILGKLLKAPNLAPERVENLSPKVAAG